MRIWPQEKLANRAWSSLESEQREYVRFLAFVVIPEVGRWLMEEDFVAMGQKVSDNLIGIIMAVSAQLTYESAHVKIDDN